MNIRIATEQDVKNVKNLVDTLQVSRRQDGWKERDCGLFEYLKSEDELRIALNPFFVVAETSQGIRGYSLGYGGDFFRRKYGNTRDTEFRFILDNFGKSFLYIDQLGVLNPDSLGGMRIANSLMGWNIEQARQKEIKSVVAYACEKPVLNRRSVTAMFRRSFERLEGVNIGNGIVLGAYVLNIR